LSSRGYSKHITVVTGFFKLLFILTANWFSPGGSGTTVRHNTQTIYITQNNTTIKRNTAHKTTRNNTLQKMKIQQSQLQLYKVVLIKISMLYTKQYSHEMIALQYGPVRRDPDKSLAFPIFLFAAERKEIFVGGLNKLEQ
jgi:hypothetical protein